MISYIGSAAQNLTMDWKSSWTHSGPLAFVLGEQVERTFSEARPVAWVTGKALLAGTFSAHWVDVMAVARLSQSVKDSPSFFWLKCRGVSVCKCAMCACTFVCMCQGIIHILSSCV